MIRRRHRDDDGEDAMDDVSERNSHEENDHADEDDGVDDEDENEDVDSDDKEENKKGKGTAAQARKPSRKRRKVSSLIDDAAQESGEEDGFDEEEDDDDEDSNDYVKDGFVVDDNQGIEVKKDELEDSDDYDDDDDDDDDDKDDDDDADGDGDGGGKRRKASHKRLKKVRKMKDTDRLDDEDLALIQEAEQRDRPTRDEDQYIAKSVIAKTGEELRKGLFEDDEDDARRGSQQKQQVRVEKYDEDGMDDFIDDDIGDQGDIIASERRGRYDEDGGDNINEAQLTEASEIFGTDYLDFVEGDQEEEEELMGSKWSGRNVNSTHGVDSEDLESDDGDDLFGDDDDDDDIDSEQKSEEIRLNREKLKLAKAERRRLSVLNKSMKRKAALRRIFEPVQLVENFCTDRDDEIRQKDVPERLYDLNTPFYGSFENGLTQEEEQQSRWIASKIPSIQSELTSASREHEQRSILESIAAALRFVHRDKLEPAFIRIYRSDYVVSDSVRSELYSILDEDGEWHRLLTAKAKVRCLIEDMSKSTREDNKRDFDESKVESVRLELQRALLSLEECAKQESDVKAELEALDVADDDDDELFGDDEDKSEEKGRERARLEAHFGTLRSLFQVRNETVSRLQSQLSVAEAQNESRKDPRHLDRVRQNISQNYLWDTDDLLIYLDSVFETRHILDVNGYITLLKEGDDAIQKKEVSMITADKHESRRRSRRYDRDFYRTCVAEGLRHVCYRFLLVPYRVGIKLWDTQQFGSFDFSKTLRVNDDESPQQWTAPVILSSSPSDYANDLIGSGELAALSFKDDHSSEDPFRGCRYVAAMELAHEPRVRRCLRDIYRRNVLLSTAPTKKGIEEIDAFHDYYGLHLIRNKPVKDILPIDSGDRKSRMSVLNRIDRRERCLRYLHVLKAEQSGDIRVHLHLPFHEQTSDWYAMSAEAFASRHKQNLSCLMDCLKRVYLPLDGDTCEWNQEREKVLMSALISFLLPQFDLELRRDLRDEAGSVGTDAAADNFRKSVMQGPYRPLHLLHSANMFLKPTGNIPIVGVCVSSDSKDATYFAAVTERGVSSDFLAIPSGTTVQNDKVREKVVLFLIQKRPHAILVGTSGGFESRSFLRMMNDVLVEALNRWKNRVIQGDDEDDDVFLARQLFFRQLLPPGHYDYDHEEWSCNIDLVDDSVAQLYARSVRGKKEFPEYGVNLKCAIAAARFGQDPLGEYTYAWNVASDAGVFGTEMLYLNIHPMQQYMPKTLLLRKYERVLCDAVAEIGTEINAASLYDHLKGMLMFVPGLGPRKAAQLKRIMTYGGAIVRRRDLLEQRMLGPIVYNNAVSFLRISVADHLTSHLLHPLDATRLHPDLYLRNNWAIKIAFDALERDDTRSSEVATVKALRDVMENSHREVKRLFQATKDEWEKHYGPTFNVKDWDPRSSVPADMWRDKVEELDLNAFANMIEENEHGRWHSHLEMIKWEFRLPFTDPRKPMDSLSGDRLFRLITGETDQSLRPGKEVIGKVVGNGDFGTKVQLEGQIPSFIPLRNLSDEHVECADDFVQPGQVIIAVVTEVKKDHMNVDLSMKMEDLRRKPSSWDRPTSLPPLDEYFDGQAAAKIEEDNSFKREARVEALQISLGLRNENGEVVRKKPTKVVRRACTHPAFRNAKHSEVTKELKEGGASMVGEALIHPSSKSPDSLALHWMIRDGIIKVIEIQEEDKETEASIGNILKIKDETYGSIDELLGRYVAPMNDFVEEVINHRKFMDTNEDEVDEKLMEMKKHTPKSIPYALCWVDSHPGYVFLRFVGSVTPRNHVFAISPRGYQWGGDTFTNLDRLINEFKRNPRGVSSKPAGGAEKAKPKISAKNRWGAVKSAVGTVPDVTPAANATTPNRPPPPSAPPVTAPLMVPSYSAPPAYTMHAYPSYPQVSAYHPQMYPPTPNGYLPPSVPPPQHRPPPPSYAPPPPPPPLPPSYALPPNFPPPPNYHQPSLLPQSKPPPFDHQVAPSSQGRGRGRTLPAWMSKS